MNSQRLHDILKDNLKNMLFKKLIQSRSPLFAIIKLRTRRSSISSFDIIFKFMNIRAKELLQELNLEAEVTRKFLQNVPFDKSEFKPAEKSETLGRSSNSCCRDCCVVERGYYKTTNSIL